MLEAFLPVAVVKPTFKLRIPSTIFQLSSKAHRSIGICSFLSHFAFTPVWVTQSNREDEPRYSPGVIDADSSQGREACSAGPGFTFADALAFRLLLRKYVFSIALQLHDRPFCAGGTFREGERDKPARLEAS